jgi:hypothetical protein
VSLCVFRAPPSTNHIRIGFAVVLPKNVDFLFLIENPVVNTKNWLAADNKNRVVFSFN